MTSPSTRRQRGQKRWIPRQWRDHVELYNYLEDFDTQKQAAYDDMDEDGFGYWTVCTAGAGFLTGAYDIFAVNTVVPIISIVYWGGKMPANTQLTISMASLVGTFFGQIIFGILGDRYGRKKMFSHLLVGLICGTVFLALISRGAQESLNILALIVFWRIWMGIFIGGDYPLSAAMTAEFAPKDSRGQMLSAVFFGQPLGQLLACFVSLATTSALRHGISGTSQTQCTGQCLHTADIIWRWIVGCGAVPPIFALILRFYIPESPRWLLEVEKNPMGIAAAAYTVDKFYMDPLLDDDIEVGMMDNVPDIPPSSYSEHGTVAQYAYDQQLEQPGASQMLTTPAIQSEAGSSTVVNPSEIGRADSNPSPRRRPMAPQDLIFKGPRVTENDPDAIAPVNHGAQHMNGYGEDLPTPALQLDRPADTTSARQLPRQPELESWADFWRSFQIYLFDVEPWTWERLWLCLKLQDNHFFDGSWTDLAGLAFTWFLLDFGFYFLIVNSFKLMTRIWATDDPDDVYTVIFQYAWRIITSTSIGAVAGGAIFIAMARNRWKLQFYGFLVLVALFVISGVVFIKLIGGRYFATFIVLYCLCHLSFNLGPNTSTFVIAAEVFPTKFRATCHGISAAAGKFGSIATQIFLTEAKINGKGVNDLRSHWLGWALIIQAVVMLAGAIFTLWWVPNPCDINGKPRSLEDLGHGKQARQAMERAEKEEKLQDRKRNH